MTWIQRVTPHKIANPPGPTLFPRTKQWLSRFSTLKTCCVCDQNLEWWKINLYAKLHHQALETISLKNIWQCSTEHKYTGFALVNCKNGRGFTALMAAKCTFSLNRPVLAAFLNRVSPVLNQENAKGRCCQLHKPTTRTLLSMNLRHKENDNKSLQNKNHTKNIKMKPKHYVCSILVRNTSAKIWQLAGFRSFH